MSNDAIDRLISDIGRTIERADPAIARAALAHLFAAAVVRPLDADVEHLNPHLVAAINAFRRSATRQRKHPGSSLIEAATRAARKDYGRRLQRSEVSFMYWTNNVLKSSFGEREPSVIIARAEQSPAAISQRLIPTKGVEEVPESFVIQGIKGQPQFSLHGRALAGPPQRFQWCSVSMKKKVVLLITLSDANLDQLQIKTSFSLCIRHQEDLMPETALKNVPAPTGRFGLTKGALVRLWRNAIKDDDKLVDEAIQDVYDRTMSFDRERAEVVMSLIIRRHRDAQRAFKALLDDMRRSGCRPAPAMASTALQRERQDF